MSQASAASDGARLEVAAAAALLALGVGSRIAFAREFPAIPFSDFRALLDFGLVLESRGWSAHSWHWIQFNPGLAMILALLFRIFPPTDALARLATAAATGAVPILPFVLWRPILAVGWRFLAGLLLALWPGQIFFSPVLAQENWVLLPAVSLGCLAVRVLRAPSRAPLPVVAGLLLAAAAAFRQEMLLVLAPAALAAAGVARSDGSRLRRAAALALAAGLPLAMLAFQRFSATGRFAITTEHGGLALLGSVAPGAASAGWVDPKAHIASIEPELLRDRTAARRASSRLALAEWRRRPGFHSLRAAAAALRLSVESDADDLFWSVGSAEALPAEKQEAGRRFYARSFPILLWELAWIQGLFLASVFVGWRRKDAAILVLAACVALKYALQSVASPLSRLILPATALELLAIALGLAALAGSGRGRRAGFAIAFILLAALLLAAEPRLEALAVSLDEPARHVARFPLEVPEAGFVQCAVETGEVTFLEWKRAWILASARAPAQLTCDLPPSAVPLVLRIERRSSEGHIGRAEVAGERVDFEASREIVLGPGEKSVVIRLSTPAGVSFRRATPP